MTLIAYCSCRNATPRNSLSLLRLRATIFEAVHTPLHNAFPLTPFPARPCSRHPQGRRRLYRGLVLLPHHGSPESLVATSAIVCRAECVFSGTAKRDVQRCGRWCGKAEQVGRGAERKKRVRGVTVRTVSVEVVLVPVAVNRVGVVTMKAGRRRRGRIRTLGAAVMLLSMEGNREELERAAAHKERSQSSPTHLVRDYRRDFAAPPGRPIPAKRHFMATGSSLRTEEGGSHWLGSRKYVSEQSTAYHAVAVRLHLGFCPLLPRRPTLFLLRTSSSVLVVAVSRPKV